MKTQIIETKAIWVKDPNTKTTYTKKSEEVTEITKQEHEYITHPDSCKWFRRLGGAETREMGYTSAGYLCTKLTSTSPFKDIKILRTYKFI